MKFTAPGKRRMEGGKEERLERVLQSNLDTMHSILESGTGDSLQKNKISDLIFPFLFVRSNLYDHGIDSE